MDDLISKRSMVVNTEHDSDLMIYTYIKFCWLSYNSFILKNHHKIQKGKKPQKSLIIFTTFYFSFNRFTNVKNV